MTTRTILFLDHASALGGAERSLLMLLERLDRTQLSPQLACIGGPLSERAAALGIPVHKAQLSRLRRSFRAPLVWSRTAVALAGLAREMHACALVANTVRAATYAAPAAWLARTPLVWYMRDFWLSETEPRFRGIDTFVKGLLCMSSAAVIANSGATAQHLPCRNRTAVVHNGIEVGRYLEYVPSGDFRAKHGIPEDAPVVGMVGRLRPWKGQDRFLDVLDRVRESAPTVYGLVVGGAVFGASDGYAEHLANLAKELGLGDRVIFTGQVDDPRAAFAAMDVFVHPGDPEPFGLVNVEAMAMAKPVVAFAHGALPEIVIDGQTGILVPPRGKDAMALAIVGLLHDSEMRSRLGRAGRERAVKEFSVDRTVRQVSQVLEGVLL